MRKKFNLYTKLIESFTNYNKFFQDEIFLSVFIKGNELASLNDRIDNLIDITSAYHQKFENSVSKFFKISFYSFYIFQIVIILISLIIGLLILGDVKRDKCLFKMLAHINWVLSATIIILISLFLFGLFNFGSLSIDIGKSFYNISNQYGKKCFNQNYSTEKIFQEYVETVMLNNTNNSHASYIYISNATAYADNTHASNSVAKQPHKAFDSPIQLINYYTSNFVQLYIEAKQDYLKAEDMLLELKRFLEFIENPTNAILWKQKDHESKVIAAFSHFQRLISHKTKFFFQSYLNCPKKTRLQVEFLKKNCDVPLEEEELDPDRHDITINKHCFYIKNLKPKDLINALKYYKIDQCQDFSGMNKKVFQSWRFIDLIENRYQILYDFYNNFTQFRDYFGKKVISR